MMFRSYSNTCIAMVIILVTMATPISSHVKDKNSIFTARDEDMIFYYINTSEIPSELSRENFISSHVKITCYLHM